MRFARLTHGCRAANWTELRFGPDGPIQSGTVAHVTELLESRTHLARSLRGRSPDWILGWFSVHAVCCGCAPDHLDAVLCHLKIGDPALAFRFPKALFDATEPFASLPARRAGKEARQRGDCDSEHACVYG